MKVRTALAFLTLAAFTPGSTFAAKKGGGGNPALPSTHLEPMLEPALNAILAPLEKDPKMPRIEVEKMRATFGAGLVTAPDAQHKQIFQNLSLIHI